MFDKIQPLKFKQKLTSRQRVKMWISLGIIALLSVSPSGSSLAQDGASIKLNDPKIQGELASLPIAKIATQRDPVYRRDSRYEGYEIHTLISWLITRAGISETEAVITFIATDGYRSSTKLSQLPKRAGVLAYRELSSNGKPFNDSSHGKKEFNPGPYVLVWEGEYGVDDNLPTPWSITEIAIERDIIPKEIVPKEASERVKHGMNLWREHCFRCHSINKVGGAVGPELNVPVNITEYWPRERLHQMIENSNNLRWGSSMPPFSWLSPNDREAIVLYLEAMRSLKVCSSGDGCK